MFVSHVFHLFKLYCSTTDVGTITYANYCMLILRNTNVVVST